MNSSGKVDGHASDCAIHNEPAYPAGPCDCGFKPPEWSCTWSVFGLWVVKMGPAPEDQIRLHRDDEGKARLIATAPLLLRALRVAREIVRDAAKDTAMEISDEHLALIDEAISKADPTPTTPRVAGTERG